MAQQTPEKVREPLTPEDLNWWYSDQPRQRNTMAMLMLIDRPPVRERLRANACRAVEVVPRVVDAPFDVALPRWERDPTFDLDFHLRRYSLQQPARACVAGWTPSFRRLGTPASDRTVVGWDQRGLRAPTRIFRTSIASPVFSSTSCGRSGRPLALS